MFFERLYETSHEIEPGKVKQQEHKIVNETSEDPVDILRSNGFKIKSITPTNFGIEIQLAKSFDKKIVMDLLSSFNINIKKNFIFIKS